MRENHTLPITRMCRAIDAVYPGAELELRWDSYGGPKWLKARVPWNGKVYQIEHDITGLPPEVIVTSVLERCVLMFLRERLDA